MIYSIDIPDNGLSYDLDDPVYTPLTVTNLLTRESFIIHSFDEFRRLVEDEIVLGAFAYQDTIECGTNDVVDFIKSGVCDGRGFMPLTFLGVPHLVNLWHPLEPDLLIPVKQKLYDKLIENDLPLLTPDSQAVKFSLMYGVSLKSHNGILLELGYDKSSSSLLPLYKVCNQISDSCVFDRRSPEKNDLCLDLDEALLLSLAEHTQALYDIPCYYSAETCSKASLVEFAITIIGQLPDTKGNREKVDNHIKLHVKGVLRACLSVAVLCKGWSGYASDEMVEFYSSLTPELQRKFSTLVTNYLPSKYPITKSKKSGLKYNKVFVNYLDYKLDSKFFSSMAGLLGTGFDIDAYIKFGGYADILDKALITMLVATEFDSYVCYLRSLSGLCRLEYRATHEVSKIYLEYADMHFTLLFQVLERLRR